MSTGYTYRLEMQGPQGEWFSPAGLAGEQRGFLIGYMWGRADGPPPSLAMRVVRSDGKVVDEREADDDVSIGMVAGWPTPEQYEAAAERALATAARIRDAQGVKAPQDHPREITVKDVLHMAERGTVFVVAPDDHQIEDLVLHEGKCYRVVGIERFPRMPRADIALVVREVTLSGQPDT